MVRPDFNLLVTLDVLLAEGSVARAAQRLRLSPSAMSRALARLRETTGDPLLVRAGRGLVPTPRALELRSRVGQLVQDADAVLSPTETLDLAQLNRRFTLRTSEGFVENFGPQLIARVEKEAPGVRLRFMQKPNKDSTPLRDGTVDLETGVVGDSTGPEVRAQALFRDRFIGVVRTGHPLARGRMTPARYAAGRHISVSRRGLDRGPIDEALQPLGLDRHIVTIVGGFATALALARTLRWVPFVEVGIEGEREGDGARLLGPTVALEIPLFGKRQSAVLRLQARREQAMAEAEAVRAAVANGVATAVVRVQSAQARVQQFREGLVPQSEAVVARMQELQNYMLVGQFELLLARQEAYQAYAGYLDTLRDYWLARVALQRALGAALPGETPRQAPLSDAITLPDAAPTGHDAHAGHDRPNTNPHTGVH